VNPRDVREIVIYEDRNGNMRYVEFIAENDRVRHRVRDDWLQLIDAMIMIGIWKLNMIKFKKLK